MNDAAPALTSEADSILRTADLVGDAWCWLVMREAALRGVTRPSQSLDRAKEVPRK